MRRKLLNIGTALSLIVSAATLVLWAMSSRYTLGISHTWDLPTPANDSEFAATRHISLAAGYGDLDFFLATALGIVWHRPDFDRGLIVDRPQATAWRADEGLRFGSIPADQRIAWLDILRGRWLWVGPRRLGSGSMPPENITVVSIPLWEGVAFFAIPGSRFIRRRRRPDECPTCGYSLTGNVSGVCPECGTPVAKAPADKSPRPA